MSITKELSVQVETFKSLAQQIQLSAEQTYGSILLIAEGAEKSGAEVSGLNNYIADLSKNIKDLDPQRCKKMAQAIGDFQDVNIGGKQFKVRTPLPKKLFDHIEKVNKEYKKTDKQSEKTNKNQQKHWHKTADAIGSSADKAVMAIDSVSGAFGGGSSGLSGVVGDVIELLKNPFTLAISAVGFAVIGVVKLWDQWNESLQQATQKAKFLKQITAEKQKKGEESKQFNSSLIQRLKEINKDGVLDQLQNTEALQIIDALIKKLVQLGFAEDELKKKIKVENGKILGLDLAEIKLAIGATQQAIDLAKTNADSQAHVATKSFNKAHKSLSGYSFLNQDVETQHTSSKIRTAEDVRKFRFDAKDSYSHVNNDGSITNLKRDKSQVGFEKQWNFLMQMGNLQGVLDLLQKKFKGVKSGSAVEQIQDLYNSIKLLAQQQEKLDNLSKSGAKDQKEYFSNLSKQTREYQQNVSKQTQSKKSEYDKNLEDFENQKATDKLSSRKQYNLDADTSMYLSAQISTAEQALTQYDSKLEQAKKKRDELLKKANEKTKSGNPLTQAQITEVRQASDAYIRLYSDRITAENKIIQLKNKQLDLDKKIYDMQLKTNQFVKDTVKKSKQNILNTRDSIRGDWDKYHNRVFNADTKQYGSLSQQQKKQILNQQQQQRTFNVAVDMRKKMQDLYYSALGGKSAERQKMYKDYEEKKQAKLTNAEISMIDKIVDLQTSLKNTTKLNLSDAQIKTNELTARGGFKGGAVAPNVDRVNMLVANNTQTTVGILNQIKTILNSGLKI